MTELHSLYETAMQILEKTIALGMTPEAIETTCVSAILTDRNNIYTGLNGSRLQNGVPSKTCSEYEAITAMMMSGENRIIGIVSIAFKNRQIVVPCDSCRELICRINPDNITCGIMTDENTALSLQMLLSGMTSYSDSSKDDDGGRVTEELEEKPDAANVDWQTDGSFWGNDEDSEVPLYQSDINNNNKDKKNSVPDILSSQNNGFGVNPNDFNTQQLVEQAAQQQENNGFYNNYNQQGGSVSGSGFDDNSAAIPPPIVMNNKYNNNYNNSGNMMNNGSMPNNNAVMNGNNFNNSMMNDNNNFSGNIINGGNFNNNGMMNAGSYNNGMMNNGGYYNNSMQNNNGGNNVPPPPVVMNNAYNNGMMNNNNAGGGQFNNPPVMNNNGMYNNYNANNNQYSNPPVMNNGGMYNNYNSNNASHYMNQQLGNSNNNGYQQPVEQNPYDYVQPVPTSSLQRSTPANNNYSNVNGNIYVHSSIGSGNSAGVNSQNGSRNMAGMNNSGGSSIYKQKLKDFLKTSSDISDEADYGTSRKELTSEDKKAAMKAAKESKKQAKKSFFNR